jgi:glycosyltransferase involved in cell wall biosynthesis
MIARYAKYKRHDIVIQALDILRRSIPNVHLVLVGEVFTDNDVYQSVLTQVESLGLDNVTFLGFQPDTAAVGSAADASVLCSDGEPLGTSILEAMALAVPVVITDSGGLKELVNEEHAPGGLIIPGGDAEALAGAIGRILTDTELAVTLGRQGRMIIENRASSATAARGLMAIYSEILFG